MSKKRPNGYWRDFDNVKLVITEMTDKLGYYPSGDDLSRSGYSTLPAVISKYHGGMLAVRRKMNIPKVFRKSKIMLEVESKIGEPIEFYLKREYLDNRRSTVDISKELQINWGSVGLWLGKFGIKRRSTSEQLLRKGTRKPSKKQLEMWYMEQRLSPNKIKEKINVSWPTIIKWIREYEIPTRDLSESKMSKNGRKPTHKELAKLYLGQRIPMHEIAKMYGVTMASIRNWCDDYGIKRRSNSESQLPNNFKKPTKKQLERMYVKEQLSLKEIGNKFGVSEVPIRKIARGYGIPIRNGGKYNDKSLRKNLVDALLSIRDKGPEELTTTDFQKTKRDGVLCFAGVLNWYERAYKCGPREARFAMLQELYGVERNSVDNVLKLENLLERYAGGEDE